MRMRKKRAIIYDDNESVLKMLAMFLSEMGYDVLPFNWPLTCPVYENQDNNCDKKQPCADIIITDFHMPVMNGTELLLKQAEQGCKLDIRNKAIMSGHISNDTKEMISRMGCAFFQKPFRLNDLSSWMKECESRMNLSEEISFYERRREQRFPFQKNIEISVLLNSRESVLNGSIFNISNSGMGVCMGSDPIRKGQEIFINASLPNVCRNGNIRWISKEDNSMFMAGIACQ